VFLKERAVILTIYVWFNVIDLNMDPYVDAIDNIKEDFLSVKKLNSEFTPVETDRNIVNTFRAPTTPFPT